MRKLILGAAVASALAAPGAVSTAYAQAAAAPASPITYNVGVVSDYLFRGISQTHGRPAIQGGIDYAHSSGLYLGAWASQITWVKDLYSSGRTEIDVYGGYKNAFAGGDWNYDVGYITYNYPGSGKAYPTNLVTGVAGAAKPNTQEAYGALGYKWLTAKYSYATSSNFIGWQGGVNSNQKTRGSDYLELNANYEMGDGWTLIGHYGQQKVKGSVTLAAALGSARSASYNDWKLGVSKDVGFGTVTLAYSDTDAAGNCTVGTTTPSAYCWGNSGNVNGVSGPTAGFKNASRGTAVLSFLKTF
jgi:uncharacterized protein (TIGR02001 family)